MVSPGTSAVFTPEACFVHNAPDTVLLGLPLSWAAIMMLFARTRVGHNEVSGKVSHAGSVDCCHAPLMVGVSTQLAATRAPTRVHSTTYSHGR